MTRFFKTYAIMILVMWSIHQTKEAIGQELGVKIYPPDKKAIASESFTLNVVADNVRDLGSFQFDITFLTSIVHADSAWLGNFLGSTGRSAAPVGPIITNTGTTGKVTMGGFSFGSGSGANGSGVLGSIKFTAQDTGKTTISLQHLQVTDVNGQAQNVARITDGVVSVVPAAPSTPTLVSPVNGVVSQPTTMTLRWNPSAEATTYRLQISTSSTFATTIVNDSTIIATSREIGSLANNTTYYWRVKAKNAGGSSMWSTVWNFTTIVQAPSQVLLVSPSNTAIVETDSVVCIWRRSGPAIEKYCFEFAANSAMANSTIDSTLTAADTTKTVRQLVSNQTYWWQVRARNAAGWGPFSEQRSFSVLITGVQINGDIPIEFGLSQNYPNPFNPETTISYQLPRQVEVCLEIFNLLGEKVTTLVDETQPAGYYTQRWNGLDRHNQPVPSGVYLYSLKAGEFSGVRKMVLVR